MRTFLDEGCQEEHLAYIRPNKLMTFVKWILGGRRGNLWKSKKPGATYIIHEMAAILCFECFPSTYLGMPLGGKIKDIVIWQGEIEKYGRSSTNPLEVG